GSTSQSTVAAPGALVEADFIYRPRTYGLKPLAITVSDPQGAVATLTAAYGAARKIPEAGADLPQSAFGDNAVDPSSDMSFAGTPTMPFDSLAAGIGVHWMRYHQFQ